MGSASTVAGRADDEAFTSIADEDDLGPAKPTASGQARAAGRLQGYVAAGGGDSPADGRGCEDAAAAEWEAVPTVGLAPARGQSAPGGPGGGGSASTLAAAAGARAARAAQRIVAAEEARGGGPDRRAGAAQPPSPPPLAGAPAAVPGLGTLTTGKATLAMLRQQYAAGGSSSLTESSCEPEAEELAMTQRPQDWNKAPDIDSMDEAAMAQMWEEATVTNRQAAAQPSPWSMAARQPLLGYTEAWTHLASTCGDTLEPRLEVEGLQLAAAIEKDALVGVARARLGEEPMHHRLLQSVWRRLSGSSEVAGRIGQHWVSIGFQGTDPSTDLRGVGLLGLAHLLLFAERAPMGLRSGIAACRHGSRHFPFAVASFNFSKLAVDLLLEGRLTAICNGAGQCEQVVGSIYVGSFCRFLQRWEHEGLAVEDFGRVLREIAVAAERGPQALLREGETSR